VQIRCKMCHTVFNDLHVDAAPERRAQAKGAQAKAYYRIKTALALAHQTRSPELRVNEVLSTHCHVI
jgi:hypothetical protein